MSVLMLLALGMSRAAGPVSAADDSLSWCRYDKACFGTACFGTVEYHAAAEACFWAIDGAMPYKASWRFSRDGYSPPERAFLGFKIVNLRKGIVRLVGDRIVGPRGGKYGVPPRHFYSCDWHAVDRRISRLSIYEERRAPGGLRRGLRRPNCRRYECGRPPAWGR